MTEYRDDDYDQYIEDREVDWFTRISESIQGMGIGLLVVIFSFVILIWNEGQTIVNQVAQEAVPITSTSNSTKYIGKLVSTSGLITSNDVLGDNLFVAPGNYIALARSVEMYAWVETRDKEAKTNLGGSQQQKITATYKKQWVPIEDLNKEWRSLLGNDTSVVSSTKSSSFLQPQNHQNPSASINNAAYKVSTAKIGNYNLDMQSFQLPSSGSVKEAFNEVNTIAVELPTPTPFQASQANTIKGTRFTNVSNYIYKSSSSNPNIGDLRFRYATLNANTNVTIIGKLESSNRIVPYIHKNNHRLYRIFSGTEAKARVKQEDRATWGFRFLGFIAMWAGLRFISEPINVFLDFVPFFGDLGRFVTGTSTLIIAVIWTIATIVIYQLTQNLILLGLTLVGIFAIFITLKQLKFN